jgi:signal transduction histidine kinase
LDAQRAQQILADDYDLETFQDGSAALERLASDEPPDLMVLDWVMPGISGVDVCRFLRSGNERQAQIGILLLTSHRDTEQIVEGLSAGANDYLAKPYADTELKARVRSQIRARELLERAIRAEEQVRRFLESAPDPMFGLDGEGRVAFVNPEGCRLLKASHAEVLGFALQDLIPNFPALPHGEHPPDSFLSLPDVEVGGRLFSPTMRLSPSQQLNMTTISLRDVTARRQAEARRLDFYSIIAHDLRSPLHAVSLRTQLILGGKHGTLSPELSADILKINAHIQAQVSMINDFLEMARVEATSTADEFERVDLAALLDQVMESFRPLLEGGALSWQRVGPGAVDDASVAGDARRLKQVLSNLLGNAIKFTPPQGVITTRIRRDGEWVEVVVEDTGCGVPREAMPTLFERFTRGRGAQGNVQGSGLGLMIVREIVEAHGGSVGVDEQRSHGSRFWIRLPSTPSVVGRAPANGGLRSRATAPNV